MFLKHFKIIFAAVFFAFAGCDSPGSNVVNIYDAKNSVKEYHESGKYLRDVTKLADQAKSHIANRIKKAKSNEKLAIVFDVDDTMLTEYEYHEEHDFSQILPPLIEWLKKGQIPELIPILDLFNFSKKQKLNIFIITGRFADLKDPTIINLNYDGYKDWNEIFFHPIEHSYASAEEFKTAVRKKITEDGYIIIVNIGDQLSDLKGEYAEKTYKLPNHIYYIK